MQYLWEVALRADEDGVAREALQYVPAKVYSPYMEVSFLDLNTKQIEERVIEANPLYRFADVFGEVFDINLTASRQTRELLFDVCMQFMIQLDLRQGLTKDEYYLRFILRDILDGAYGAEAARAVGFFSARELRNVLACLLALDRCGGALALFRRAMRIVYPKSLVYLSNEIFREILIYIGRKETEAEREKVAFLLEFFLSPDYTAHLFWEHHFGIIDIEETMELGEMELF